MNEGNFFRRVLEAEAETRVPGGPGSGEPCSGLQTAVFSLGPHVAQKVRAPQGRFLQGPLPIHEGAPKPHLLMPSPWRGECNM